MKLLISATDEKEATEAIEGGADIIDVKNPREGSLGASFPWIIKCIKGITPHGVELSCTVGDVVDHPSATALAALGAATMGVDYVKIGLQGVTNTEDAIYAMQNIRKAIKDYNSQTKIVVVGYADAKRAHSLDPMEIPRVAYGANLDVAMIDTAIKDGKNVFAFLTRKQLSGFIESSHGWGIAAALAGSLRKEDVPTVVNLRADFVGIRSAACARNDRLNGRLEKELIHELAAIVHKY